MFDILPKWFLLTMGSAVMLGLYDFTKKHAVHDNSVMPVLFFTTFSGMVFYIVVSALTGSLSMVACSWRIWGLLWVKSLIVGSSWILIYYAMRELPISIASPIRASSPLWTFIGSLFIFHEIPTAWQAVGMVFMFAGYYAFSVLGKMEGISFLKARGIHLIFLGTICGAGSSLYDKFLLNLQHIPVPTVQFWFSVDLVILLGTAYAIRTLCFGRKHGFQWRWSIPVTGILIILADFLFFHAVSQPGIQISIISLVRRTSCVVSFVVGVWYFHDVNVKKKALALLLFLVGTAILALAK